MTLNSKAEHLLEQILETGRYVFLNPKTGTPYQPHEFYYHHKRILKQAACRPAFRNLQHLNAGGGDITLREYILRWQEVYDKNQSRPTGRETARKPAICAGNRAFSPGTGH